MEAYKVEGRESWVVTNPDGSETILQGERFHQLYERVSDLRRIDIDEPLPNQRCPYCGALISRQCVVCTHCLRKL